MGCVLSIFIFGLISYLVQKFRAFSKNILRKLLEVSFSDSFQKKIGLYLKSVQLVIWMALQFCTILLWQVKFQFSCSLASARLGSDVDC